MNLSAIQGTSQLSQQNKYERNNIKKVSSEILLRFDIADNCIDTIPLHITQPFDMRVLFKTCNI